MPDKQIDALIEPAVARGGHVRVGLEDAPFGHAVSNVDQVRAARRKIEAMLSPCPVFKGCEVRHADEH